MNYFAHGLAVIDDPYRLAGTTIPDCIRVSEGRLRIRRRHAAPWVADADPRLAALARGIVDHHDDDEWFHRTAAFAAASWELTRQIRDLLVGDEGFRPSFLGHILVEILLDDLLIADHPPRLEAYYQALASLDPHDLQATLNRLAPRPAERLAQLWPAFCRERFLSDYADDEKLLRRLNQIMRRVKLPELPAEFVQLLPGARRLVAEHRAGLLARPPGPDHAPPVERRLAS